MADLSKADKIAAGYKKLKEFQQKNRKSDTKSKKSVESNSEHSETRSQHGEDEETSTNGSNNNFSTENINFDKMPNDQQSGAENDTKGFYEYNTTFYNDQTSSNGIPSIQSYFENSVTQDNLFQNLINNDGESTSTPSQQPPEEKIISEQSTPPPPEVNLSNIENIRQLASEMKRFYDSDEPATIIQSTQEELEYRNQELAGMLESRNVEVAQLTARLQEYFTRIQELETQLRAAQSEVSCKLQSELQPLKEQLEYHAKTIGLLVAEKSELSAALEANQTIIKEKVSENEELQYKLRASKHRVSDLEREMVSLKSTLDSRAQCHTEDMITSLKTELDDSRKRVDDLVEEVSELTQKLNTRSEECLALKEQLADKTNQLSLLEIKLHQVCNNESSQLEMQVETLTKEKLAMELKINHLADELKSVSLEQDKTNEQYQQYVTQLNDQLKNYSSQNEYLTKCNTKLQKRETELVAHITTLEKEIQNLHKQKTTPPQLDQVAATTVDQVQHQLSEKITKLEQILQERSKEIATITEEKKDLLKELENRNYQIASLEEKISEMERDQPNYARLAAVMESDKVAAAQAIKQNAKLTKQVEELQDKLVELTQRELTVTEKLGAEQHLGEEILKKLKAREEELEILKQQQRPMEEKQQQNPMEEKQQEDVTSSPPDISTETEQRCMNCDANERKLEKVEAMQKLEERFTRTMEELARLTEEKNELEHLVMQLQSETETIGEYVALYQFQRGVLKQRSIEKDEELRLLNQDREQMKQKLAELNHHVQQFLTQPGTVLAPPTEHTTITTPPPIVQTERADKIMELISEINSSNLIEPKGDLISSHVCPLCSGQLITV